MTLLRTQGLEKRFGGLMAVDNIDFSVEPGEIVGLIGPNGAGKTTFVDLLTGVQQPSRGRIEFAGADITHLPPSGRSRLGLARTFQIPRPFHGMSVVENVMAAALFGGAMPAAAIADARRLALECLDAVGLTAAAGNTTSMLTTAGRKRLEVARCLATKPRLLFLDEPLGGLNPTEVNDALQLIRRLNEQGVAIVFIEHIVPAVVQVSSRIFVLMHGRKLAEGRPADVLADPEVKRAYLGDVSLAIAQRGRRKRQPEPTAARP